MTRMNILLLLFLATCLEAKKIKKSRLIRQPDLPKPLIMAEWNGEVNDRPDSRLSLELELESGNDDNRGDYLQMDLQHRQILFTQDQTAQLFRSYQGNVKDANGKIVGWTAVTFQDGSWDEYSGLVRLEQDRPFSLTSSDLSPIEQTAKGVHCGARHYEHAAVKHLFPGLGQQSPSLGQHSPSHGQHSHHHATDKPEQPCFPQKRIIFMGVAVDCEFVKRSGGCKLARDRAVATYNEVSSITEQAFNVALGIVELLVPTDEECSDPQYIRERAPSWNGGCDPKATLSDRLSDFSKWRATQRASDAAGLWHLLTGCVGSGEGREVGLSWIDTLGVKLVRVAASGKYVSGTAINSLGGSTLTQVAVHELGHNLGAAHDCSRHCQCVDLVTCRDCCPCATSRSACDCDGQFLMNPTTNMASLTFSPCTKRQICAALQQHPNHLHDYREAVRRVHSLPVCGNGVKEPGEECDCGTAEECARDPCCQAGCKLRPGALCSDRNDACCGGCQVTPETAMRVCRPARSFCDLPEQCDGASPDCPTDVHRPDGTDCDARDPAMHCASGVCTSRDRQCQAGAARFLATAFCPTAPHSSCHLQCVTPAGCMSLTGYLIDGTRCGERGACLQGSCVEGGPVSTVWLMIMCSLALLACSLAMTAVVLLWRSFGEMAK